LSLVPAKRLELLRP